MKCRRLKTWYDEKGTRHRDLVFFGSYGKNDDGTAKFVNPQNKHDNYSDGREAVADSLTQRLSVLQKELWYSVNYGLPLFDKTNKYALDGRIVSIVTSHPDVISIDKFESKLVDKTYKCSMIIISKYGQLTVEV